MQWAVENADSFAEAAAVIVCLDGLGVRSPWLFCQVFGIRVRPLPKGRLHGYFDSKRLTIYLDMTGEEEEITGRLCHEIGHVILFLLGHSFPHNEELVSQIGRAWTISRPEMLEALRAFSRAEVIAHYSVYLPATDVIARICEVQVSTMKHVG